MEYTLTKYEMFKETKGGISKTSNQLDTLKNSQEYLKQQWQQIELL